MPTGEAGVLKTPADLAIQFPMTCNTDLAVLFANMQRAVDAGYPLLPASCAPRNDQAIIVGGGPSLKRTLPILRQQDGDIFALNGAAKFLVENGITPHAVMILDARPFNAKFLELPRSVHVFLASQCAPEVFDAARGPVTIWHPNMEGRSGVIENRATVAIGGGTTVGIHTLQIAHILGYRQIIVHGMDSSYEGDANHAYAQRENDGEPLHEIRVGERAFLAAPWMVRQAGDFVRVAGELADAGCEIAVYGDGLLPAGVAAAAAYRSEMERGAGRLTVLTVFRSGGIFTPEYVTRLRDGVARNLTAPHRFVCLTDQPVDGVECLPLQHGWPGWWSKVEMFRPDLPFGRTLFIDLSTVVTGSLDEMAARSEPVVITKDFICGGPSQSALLYDIGAFEKTYKTFLLDPEMWMRCGDRRIAPDFGDQILMNHTQIPDVAYWQDVLPGQLVSYRLDGVTADARLVKFHGSPKPHEVTWLQGGT